MRHDPRYHEGEYEAALMLAFAVGYLFRWLCVLIKEWITR